MAADFITKDRKRDNITVKTEVTVDKVILSRDRDELTATGVVTISKTGQKMEYQAKKEVIIAAGAYCSPTILMRSGIGPKHELEEHKIDCLVNLPGVGKNLMDHVVCSHHYAKYNLLTHTPSALLHLLRGLPPKSNKRPPSAPRQRHRNHLQTLARQENRRPLHLPVRHLQLGPPRLAPRLLPPLDQRPPPTRPRPHGPATQSTQRRVLEHGDVWGSQAIH